MCFPRTKGMAPALILSLARVQGSSLCGRVFEAWLRRERLNNFLFILNDSYETVLTMGRLIEIMTDLTHTVLVTKNE